MNSKERILAAFRFEELDRVPVIPEMDQMVPAKLTGKPFWDIYLYEDPPLCKAYLAALNKYGMDGWWPYDYLPAYERDLRKDYSRLYLGAAQDLQKNFKLEVICRKQNEIWLRCWVDTPYGRLEKKMIFYRDAPPVVTEAPLKDFKEDWLKLQYLMDENRDWQPLKARDWIGERGVYILKINSPWDWYCDWREGGHVQALKDLKRYPRLLKEIFSYYMRYACEYGRVVIEAQPDIIRIGGSRSSNTIISAEIYKQVNIPFIRRFSRLAWKAGIPTHAHFCGKAIENLKVLNADERLKLTGIEPLERPPSGDIDLAEVKRRYGKRFCLKGNVHTFETMLYGNPLEVEAEVLLCLLAAGEGSGYVLSTGDQIPRDTPEENVYTFIRTGKKYGKYPLDKKRICKKLEKVVKKLGFPSIEKYASALGIKNLEI